MLKTATQIHSGPKFNPDTTPAQRPRTRLAKGRKTACFAKRSNPSQTGFEAYSKGATKRVRSPSILRQKQDGIADGIADAIAFLIKIQAIELGIMPKNEAQKGVFRGLEGG